MLKISLQYLVPAPHDTQNSFAYLEMARLAYSDKPLFYQRDIHTSLCHCACASAHALQYVCTRECLLLSSCFSVCVFMCKNRLMCASLCACACLCVGFFCVFLLSSSCSSPALLSSAALSHAAFDFHTSLTFFMLDTCFQSNTETQ